jgi:hypothetical protein
MLTFARVMLGYGHRKFKLNRIHKFGSVHWIELAVGAKFGVLAYRVGVRRQLLSVCCCQVRNVTELLVRAVIHIVLACVNPLFIVHSSGITAGVVTVINNYSVIRLRERVSNIYAAFSKNVSFAACMFRLSVYRNVLVTKQTANYGRKCCLLPSNSFVHVQFYTVGRGSSIGIATRYGLPARGSNSGRGEIFRTRPDRPCGPPNLLYNGYQVFLGSRTAGAWR